MSNIEKSIFVRAELRAQSKGDAFEIAGYAALFDSPSKNLGGFTEVVAPTAFDRSLAAKAVVRFTFNHSMDAVLARTDNGTLTLAKDSKGLRFIAKLNKNIQSHRDIHEACKSGLYNECSFAFIPGADGQKWSPDGSQRTLTDVDLLDVSLVGIPAYEGTNADARKLSGDGDWRVAYRAKLAEMEADFRRASKAHEIRLRVIADQKR